MDNQCRESRCANPLLDKASNPYCFLGYYLFLYTLGSEVSKFLLVVLIVAALLVYVAIVGVFYRDVFRPDAPLASAPGSLDQMTPTTG